MQVYAIAINEIEIDQNLVQISEDVPAHLKANDPIKEDKINYLHFVVVEVVVNVNA